MKIPHLIPYQGSKRQMAKHILPLLPRDTHTLIEPFAGSAALSIAAASNGMASRFHLNDLNAPLMALWQKIIHHPSELSEQYRCLWQDQSGRERAFYDQVRSEFNQQHDPAHLLYLLARCVKASVRYNAKGEFNQSPDNRRRGRHPDEMAEDIQRVSNLLRDRTILTSLGYVEILQFASDHDLVYLDPPYQGVSSSGDPRYYSSIKFDELVQALYQLNTRQIAFMLSYDGRTGQRVHGQELPDDLALARLELNAGRSSQSTLLGGDEITYESLYISQNLLYRLGMDREQLTEYAANISHKQLLLPFS